MESFEEEGQTVNEAVDKAIAKLGISRQEAEVEILEKGKKGVFGMGFKPARVKVTKKSAAPARKETATAVQTRTARPERHERQERSERPLMEAEPAVPATPEEAETARQLLEKLLKLAQLDAGVSGSCREGEIWLEINGADNAILIGRKGKTLDSLQLLVNRMASRDRSSSRIVVDIENYRRRLFERLEKMSTEAADKVKQTGQEVELEPMSARDRRQLHMFLKDNPDVATISRGEGEMRRVVVVKKQ